MGRTVDELLRSISWDEWIRWQAYYEIEPWGEERADGRLAVEIAYLLTPYLPTGTELPDLAWPYFGEDAEAPDPATVEAEIEAYRRRWAEWEAERLAKKSSPLSTIEKRTPSPCDSNP